MQSNYEAPELTLIGEANEVVMGANIGGDDFPKQFGLDFEFEQDQSTNKSLAADRWQDGGVLV
jgi:hypothetical protein